jgi:hypothetical protein
VLLHGKATSISRAHSSTDKSFSKHLDGGVAVRSFRFEAREPNRQTAPINGPEMGPA